MQAGVAEQIKQKRTYRRDPSKKRKPRSDKAYSVSRLMVVPSVSAAACDELLAAGWGGYERHRIPADWRSRRPSGMVKRGPKSSLNESAEPGEGVTA